MLSTMSKLFDNTIRSIQNWKKENRPIIKLIEQYFTLDELNEFLNTGKIKKFELLRMYSYEELNTILNVANDKTTSLTTVNNKLNNFDLGSLIAFEMFLKRNNVIFNNKDLLIKEITKNTRFIEIDWIEDKFSTKYNKEDLVRFIDLFFDDNDIELIFGNLLDITKNINTLIELRRGTLLNVFNLGRIVSKFKK